MLHLHRADRADVLVHALGELLATPPADPFAAEVVGVPTRGMERWLTQALSMQVGTSGPGRTDGILANVAFPSPREIAETAVAAAAGIDPRTDAWARERVVWPLLDVVDAHLEDPWLRILADHLHDSAGLAVRDAAVRPRRLVAVRRLAHLYDRYATQRPAMLARWAAGDDVDGSGAPLVDHTAWQAELWRRLRERIAAPDPAERLQLAARRIAADPGVLDLPERVALFGLTRLPAAQLEILRAVAVHRDVHVFALHPSPALWSAVGATLATHTGPVLRRADDPTAGCVANRLLESWGRDARELQLVVGAGGTDHPLESHEAAPDTLLGRLQADVRANRGAPGPPLPGADDARPHLHAADRSVELHSCHGRARQVEVLRDAILHVLHERPDLEPRDVIVMCPDIETFAPLVHATFGVGDAALQAGEEEDFGAVAAGAGPSAEVPDPVAPDLRVRLADRALRQTNPIFGTIGRLLELADGRLTASQVLDLADRAPVRRRFALDDDAIARLEAWIGRTGIRWGLDAAHRSPFKLDGLPANTWASGLDRVLLGVSMTEDEQRLVGGVLPLDDVESGAIDLAGRFAEFVHRLQTTVDRFGEPRTVRAWAQELGTAADLLTATGPRDGWQRAALDGVLAGLVDAAAGAGTAAGADAATIDLAELRDLLGERIAGRPTRANFRTGHLTFCTLAPMRSVPHAVVCLLGLDDAVFPRKAPYDGDDLIVSGPHVGDHDGRTEDRQMLLDALLAARDRLIITYTGNDERTNAPRPPAVPVGELLDVVDRTVRAPAGDDRAARAGITVRHPLQPFDPRNFTPGLLTAGRPFSHDHVTLRGARALAGTRVPRPPFLTAALPPVTGPVVELEDVVRFAAHPARAFLRQRLGVGFGDFSEDLDDAIPIGLDALQEWAVAERMLQARLGGQSMAQIVQAERARGAVPPGHLALPILVKLRDRVEAIYAVALDRLEATAQLASLDVRVPLDGGRRLSGTVAGLRGDTLQLVTSSRLGPKHRLAAWVRLLALTAARPQRPFTAVTIGRARFGAGSGRQVSIACIPPLGGDAQTRQAVAQRHLADLLALVDRGLCDPPPLACRTAAAYAGAVRAGRDPIRPASQEWTSSWGKEMRFSREDEEAEHVRVFGRVLTFDELLAIAPADGERGPGWAMDHGSRLGRWALRLWDPLLDVEEVTDR
ncbi:RecBCD enzyme subunit RecC [Paraconexibacter sp. AEG42_29]|uniref:RecBCD enzyme subunit RecC n=2 Tax=Paraconexibacter sp. AEG42_29 TaxID=2997339 RepID=A0AAU7B197_9ACTN